MPHIDLTLQKATPELASTLSTLAIRSKAYWGYSKAFMRACRDELTVSAEQINNPDWRIFVAMCADQPVGFYTLTPCIDRCWELHALFVELDAIGSGVGSVLFEHAKAQLKAAGATRLTIQSDPGAEGFYVSQGARKIGHTPSGSIAGRFLPQLELVLTP